MYTDEDSPSLYRIYCPYWVSNKTGLKLEYQYHVSYTLGTSCCCCCCCSCCCFFVVAAPVVFVFVVVAAPVVFVVVDDNEDDT